jgi:flavin prenyltransferase
MTTQATRLVIAITGASGAILGIRMLELLKSLPIETHLVLSDAGRLTIAQETDWQVNAVLALADRHYPPDDVGAPIASGSFQTCGMIIAPCSIKTLSAVANSFNQDLVARAADVTLKEGRPLVLALRETPLHRGHLRLMLQAAENGAVIFPAIPAFYHRPQSINALIDSLVGRILKRAGFENSFYQEWRGDGT